MSRVDDFLARFSRAAGAELGLDPRGAEHAGWPGPGPDDPIIGVRFRGPFEGELIVRAAEPLLLLLARASGREGAGWEAELETLGSLANAVCLPLLRELAPPEELFEVEAPRPKETAFSLVPGSALRGRADLVAEGGAMEIRFFTTPLPARFRHAA